MLGICAVAAIIPNHNTVTAEIEYLHLLNGYVHTTREIDTITLFPCRCFVFASLTLYLAAFDMHVFHVFKQKNNICRSGSLEGFQQRLIGQDNRLIRTGVKNTARFRGVYHVRSIGNIHIGRSVQSRLYRRRIVRHAVTLCSVHLRRDIDNLIRDQPGSFLRNFCLFRVGEIVNAFLRCLTVRALRLCASVGLPDKPVAIRSNVWRDAVLAVNIVNAFLRCLAVRALRLCASVLVADKPVPIRSNVWRDAILAVNIVNAFLRCLAVCALRFFARVLVADKPVPIRSNVWRDAWISLQHTVILPLSRDSVENIYCIRLFRSNSVCISNLWQNHTFFKLVYGTKESKNPKPFPFLAPLALQRFKPLFLAAAISVLYRDPVSG